LICSKCGARIEDKVKHESFHRSLDMHHSMIKQIRLTLIEMMTSIRLYLSEGALEQRKERKD